MFKKVDINHSFNWVAIVKILLFIGLVITLVGISEQRTQAIINNSANIPGEVQSYFNGATNVWENYRCRNQNDNLDYVAKMQAWISPLNNPGVIEPVYISEGTDTIFMQHNILATHCALNINTFGSLFAGDPSAAPNASSTLIDGGQFGTTSANIAYITADIPGVGYLNDSSVSWGSGFGSTNPPPPSTAYSYSTRLDIDLDNTIYCDANPANQRFYAKSSCDVNSTPVNAPIRIQHPGIANLTANADGTPRTYTINIVLFGIAVTEFGPTHPTAPNSYSCVTNQVPATGLSDTVNCAGSATFASASLTVNAVDKCDNIGGYQGAIPAGYNRTGSNDCTFPPPSCSVNNFSIGIGRAFSLNGGNAASYTNNSTANLDTVSVSYGSAISGTPGGASDDISAGATRAFPDNTAHSFTTRAARTITWTLTYSTLYGNQTFSCNQVITPTVANLSCAVQPFTISTGSSLSPRVTVTNPNGVPAQISSATYSIAGPSGPYNGAVPPPIANVTQDGSNSYDGSPVTINTPGEYTLGYSVTWLIDGLGATVPCPGGASLVSDQPYIRAYGNDVIACGVVGNSAQDVEFHGGYTGSPATNTDAANSYLGAASQLAIFASNQITGMMSGSQYTGRVSPWDLSFANNNAATFSSSLLFGGGILNCPVSPDREIPTEFDDTINNLTSITGTGGVYEWNMVSNNPLRGQIDIGERAIVYAVGDITIGNNGGGGSNNITYQNSATGWANASEIPSFTLIVDGDIYIDNSVTQLDGHYIASGDIYTCSSGGGFEDLTDADTNVVKAQFLINTADGCTQQLVVNGSFKAKNIHFLRYRGTVNTGLVREPYTSSNIAEVFRFSPEIYLTNGGGETNGTAAGSNTTRYDSIVSRPPSY